MSVFVKRNATPCAFTSSDSWVILSPIELSIKRKIEAVGTPLKDWDIQINYGIKTGCNEAFIIDEAKRAEILSRCKNAAERKRTDALIRPILRGRDIKRYCHNWAGLYLITTHNGYGKTPRIDIEYYPALKQHLDEYWLQISERSDKGDTPYNLRNCAYMENYDEEVWVMRVEDGVGIGFEYAVHAGAKRLDKPQVAEDPHDFLVARNGAPRQHALAGKAGWTDVVAQPVLDLALRKI